MLNVNQTISSSQRLNQPLFSVEETEAQAMSLELRSRARSRGAGTQATGYNACFSLLGCILAAD